MTPLDRRNRCKVLEIADITGALNFPEQPAPFAFCLFVFFNLVFLMIYNKRLVIMKGVRKLRKSASKLYIY